MKITEESAEEYFKELLNELPKKLPKIFLEYCHRNTERIREDLFLFSKKTLFIGELFNTL